MEPSTPWSLLWSTRIHLVFSGLSVSRRWEKGGRSERVMRWEAEIFACWKSAVYSVLRRMSEKGMLRMGM